MNTDTLRSYFKHRYADSYKAKRCVNTETLTATKLSAVNTDTLTATKLSVVSKQIR